MITSRHSIIVFDILRGSSPNTAMPGRFQESVTFLLNELFCSVDIQSKVYSDSELVINTPGLDFHSIKDNCGCSVDDKVAYFWFVLGNDIYIQYEIRRDRIPFTSREKAIIETLPECAKIFTEWINIDSSSWSDLRIVLHRSVGFLLVSKVLTPSDQMSSWHFGQAISLLTRLSSENYENHHSRSGFIFTESYDESNFVSTGFNVESIKPIYLTDNFFEGTLSHRYVDGVHSYYLLDKQGFISKIARYRRGRFLSRDQVLMRRHVVKLLRAIGNGSWASYIGNNRETNIIFDDSSMLKISNNKINVVDYRVLYNMLRQIGINDKIAESILISITSLSQQRLGTVILIPKNTKQSVPKRAYIDGSEVGEKLREIVVGETIDRLSEMQTVSNILSSDGITVIDVDGRIVDSGLVINLNNPGTQFKQISGGGRTQAAQIASLDGLAIKVSEDGPISVFQEGLEVFRFRA